MSGILADRYRKYPLRTHYTPVTRPRSITPLKYSKTENWYVGCAGITQSRQNLTYAVKDNLTREDATPIYKRPGVHPPPSRRSLNSRHVLRNINSNWRNRTQRHLNMSDELPPVPIPRNQYEPLHGVEVCHPRCLVVSSTLLYTNL